MLQSFGGNVFHVLCVYFIIWTFAVPTESDDVKENTAIVIFREVTISSWISDNKTAKFKDVIASVANCYCSTNYDKCALRFWNTTRTFRNSDVASYYRKQVETDIEMQFYVVLPSGNDIRKPNSTVLPKGTLDGILEANSTQIGAAVDAQVKNKADGSTTKPKADNAMDYIMIPVGFGLLIFVIILACCLHYCHKKKIEQIKKEERRQFLLKQKSEGSKPQSPFQATPIKQIPEVAVKPLQRQKPRLYYENEKNSDQHVNENLHKRPPTNKGRHEDEEQIENLYETKVDGSFLNKGYEVNVREKEDQLSEESDDERRHSKRRKKKKNKKRRHKNQGGSPQCEDNQDYGSDEDDASPPHALEDEDISSRLPPPRKLPPLRGQTTKM